MPTRSVGRILGTDPDSVEAQYDSDQATPPTETFTQISAGYFHNCGLLEDRTVKCWGLGSDAPVDEGDFDVDQASPPSGEFTMIAAAAFHTCGVRPDGSIDCWGGGDEPGPEGTPVDGNQAIPPEDGSFVSLGLGVAHSCAIGEDYSVVCWGDGDSPDVDDGPADENQAVPIRTDVTDEPCSRVDHEPFDSWECSPLCQRGCGDDEVCTLGSGPQVGLVTACNPAGTGTQGDSCDSETLTCAPGFGCVEGGSCTRYCRADGPLGPSCGDGLSCNAVGQSSAGFCVQ